MWRIKVLNQKKIEIDWITYFLLLLKGNKVKYHKSLWQEVVSDFKPDLAHLHGTEFAHVLAFLKNCPEVKVVVSIQGLVSVYSKDKKVRYFFQQQFFFIKEY